MANTPRENAEQMEIERSFLLPFISEFFMPQSKDEIDQWYLPSFRIRKKWEEFYLTKKIWPKWNCIEIEFPITKEEFEKNWEIWKDISSFKTRRYLEINWKVYEADEFKFDLEPLCMVEIEFKTKEESDAFVPPKWFWPEMTNDNRFSNFNLAKNWIDEEMKKIIGRVKETMKHIAPLELNLDDWVNWIIKGAENLLKNKKDSAPVIINIAWWSSSWKTSKVTSVVKKYLEDKWYSVVILSMDNFYFWPTYMEFMENAWTPVNYDQPEAYDMNLLEYTLSSIKEWKDVLIPSYDFQNDPTQDDIHIKKSQVVILEWLFALDINFLDAWDLKVFVDVSSHGRVIRRLLRDAWENGRSGQSANDVLHQILRDVEPMDKKYVKPQKKNSHIIISNDHNPYIESSNISKTTKQVKFKLWEIKADNISYALQSLWFKEIWEKSETDLYYNHKEKCLQKSWEILKIRFIKGSKPVFIYKYPTLNENHRVEKHFSFEIEEEVVDKLDEEYFIVGNISKTRTTFIKWDIKILLDIDVFVQNHDSLENPTFIWDFLEIQGCNDKIELNEAIEMITSLIAQNHEDAINDSYLSMLLKQK